MIRDRAVTRVQNHLSFRTDKAEDIVLYLQEVQVELEEEPVLPWFLKEELSMADTTIDEQRLPVPADFLRETEDSALWVFEGTNIVTDQWTELVKARSDTLRNTYQSTTGKPEAYYLDKKYFRLYPTPDEIYVMKMVYFKQADILDTNIENDWLEHAAELMIGMAGQRMAADFRDTVALQLFTAMEQQARQRLVLGSEAREHANQRYIMGGPN